MSVDPHMATMHGPPQDIKPDISQLNIITSSSGYSNHHPPMTQPPPGYPTPSQIMACGFTSGHHNPTVSQPGYFNMGHLQQMSPGSQVSPPGAHHSPSLHSPSGLSMTSPPPSSLTPLQSPTSTMGSPSGLIGGMTMNQAHSTFSTKHICAICGDRASGKHYGVYRYVDGLSQVYTKSCHCGGRPMLSHVAKLIIPYVLPRHFTAKLHEIEPILF